MYKNKKGELTFRFYFKECRLKAVRINDPKNPNKDSKVMIGFGLREASQRLNISSSYLCDIEKGRRQPKADLLVRMARLYRTSVDKLLYDELLYRDLMYVRENQIDILEACNQVIYHNYPRQTNKQACNSVRFINSEIKRLDEEINKGKKESKLIINYY